MMASRFILYIVLSIVLFSCSYSTSDETETSSKTGNIEMPESLVQTEYVSFYKSENPLNKNKQIGDWKYTLSYCPKELMAIKEMGGNLDTTLFKEICSHYEEMEYWDFRIENTKVHSEPLKLSTVKRDYTETVKYASFGMQNDIKLLINEIDTVECGLFNYERAYNIAPEARFTLAFPKNKMPKNIETLTFIFYDHLIDQGIIKFSFDNNTLLNAPKLELL